jgi:hypothetical protein
MSFFVPAFGAADYAAVPTVGPQPAPFVPTAQPSNVPLAYRLPLGGVPWAAPAPMVNTEGAWPWSAPTPAAAAAAPTTTGNPARVLGPGPVVAPTDGGGGGGGGGGTGGFLCVTTRQGSRGFAMTCTHQCFESTNTQCAPAPVPADGTRVWCEDSPSGIMCSAESHH